MKNRLKVLRAERDWSQADLADKLNVSRQTVNAIETERYDPSLPLAFKVVRLFKLPIKKVFRMTESAHSLGHVPELQPRVNTTGNGLAPREDAES